MENDDRSQDDQVSDPELDDALEVLKGLPQRQAAAEIGISERRLRDIEWGRSIPRRRTRDAIIRLAEDVLAGRVIDGPTRTEDADGAVSIGPLIFGGVLLVGFIALLVALSKGSEG